MKKNFFEKRIYKLREKLLKEQAFLITLPEEIFYFTGFTGDSAYLVITPEKVLFYTDLRFIEQIKREKKIELEVIELSGKNKFSYLLKESLLSSGIKSLNISKKDISFSFGEELLSVLNDTDIEVVESSLVKEIRQLKDEYEIEIIRQNLMLTEISYNVCLPAVEEGKTEKEIAGVLENFLRKNGAEKMAFDTIVASGERSVLPHGVASDKKICNNEVILFDFGIKKDGYCSDFTRCYYFGKIISQKISEIHKVVKEALKKGEMTVKAGIPVSEVHRAVSYVIEAAGYGKNFWHSSGHGIGLEIHEEPFINDRNETILQEGMVFTIEPGIYLPGTGGIRLEDIVVVRKDGTEILTTTSYEL